MKRAITALLPAAVPVDKILDWAELNLGLRRYTAEQYLELLVKGEGWAIVNGKIVSSLEEEVS